MSNSKVVLSNPACDDFWSFDNPVVFDCLEEKRRYLLSGKNGSQIKLSSSAYCLLQSVRKGQSFADVADTLNKRQGAKKVSEEELREQYQFLLAEMRRHEMNTTRGRLPWGFWMRFRLVGEGHVGKIAGVASKMFHPFAVLCVLILLIGGIFVAVQRGLPITFPTEMVLPGFGVFLIAVIAHEFGHASACARYGARPSDIGFAFYLIYPAFYGDVSDAWKLSRGQRVVVDLGGCYFQALITAFFLFAYSWTGWEPLHVAILMSLYTAISSLNPIFRFDGYWVLADMLGVANLSRQPRRIGKYLLDLVRRRSNPGLPWPAFVTTILVVYSGLAVTVWTFFILRLYPMLRWQWVAARKAGTGVVSALANGKLPLLGDAKTLFLAFLFLLPVTMMFWNIMKRISIVLMRRVKSTFQYFSEVSSVARPEVEAATTVSSPMKTGARV